MAEVKRIRSRWKFLASRNKWRVNNSSDGGHIDPNKKKVRGWKRRANDLKAWGAYIQQPYMSYWNRGGNYIHQSYKVYPWYGFYGNRRPPLWFARLILKHLVIAFDYWDTKFQEGNEPYDLFIELHDPNYILSEIEVKRIKQPGEEIFYWPLAEEQKPFPYEKYKIEGCDLNRFKWQLCEEEDFLFEDEVYWRNTTVERLLARGYTTTETDKGELYYKKKTGDVWMARKKNTSSDTEPVMKRQYPIPAP